MNWHEKYRAILDKLTISSGVLVTSVDDISGALSTIDVTHKEVHDGNHYYVKSFREINGAGTIVYFMFKTPALPTRIHARAKFDAEAEFTVNIYEDGTVDSDGTPAVALNNDRNSNNIAELKVYTAPTVTGDGTLIWTAKIGSGKSATGVSPAMGYEIIAKHEAIYLFKIVKEATSEHWIDFDLWWYEDK